MTDKYVVVPEDKASNNIVFVEGEIRTTEGQSPKSPNLPKLLCLFDVIKSPRLLIGKDIFEFFFRTTRMKSIDLPEIFF
jgi:hypothetical protein